MPPAPPAASTRLAVTPASVIRQLALQPTSNTAWNNTT
jgi:hypothetical protein